jgi:acyl-CoA synthetase (AMP-forming)/AMP-acid ligase II
MQFNLADIFESLADAFPDRPAVIAGPTRLSFGELDTRATRLAHAWQARGLGPDDHIGLYLYNGHEYVEAMLAAWKLRARTINLNYRYVAAELAEIVERGDVTAVLYEPELAEHVHALGDRFKLRMTRGPAYEAALAEASPARDFGPRSADDRFILFTGGTTGRPQGVVWRHEDLFFAALQGGQPGGEPFRDPAAMAPALAEYGDGMHIHTAAPLIHGSSQLAVWIALMNGGRAIIVPGRSFQPEASLDACEADEAHTFNLVGDAMALPLIDALAAHPGRWSLPTLSVVASAGAVLSASVRERLEELLPTAMVLNNFGASETGHQGSAFYERGKAIWEMDASHTTVVDEALRPVGPGEQGRIARFGHIPLGYYNNPEKTAATFFERDGVRYVIPGDMAEVNRDGTITFLGRGSVCINTGGEKVFAEEVEEVLKAHPDVYDAVVVGVPDPRWGERVEALCTARPGATPDPASLAAHCRAHLAGYKTPRAFWVVDHLNRQPSGKADYRWAKATAIGLGGAT